MNVGGWGVGGCVGGWWSVSEWQLDVGWMDGVQNFGCAPVGCADSSFIVCGAACAGVWVPSAVCRATE